MYMHKLTTTTTSGDNINNYLDDTLRALYLLRTFQIDNIYDLYQFLLLKSSLSSSSSMQIGSAKLLENLIIVLFFWIYGSWSILLLIKNNKRSYNKDED